MTDGGTVRPERVARFIHALVVSLLDLELHPAGCQTARDDLQALAGELAALIAGGCADPLEIGVQDTCLSHDGQVLIGSSLQARRLIDLCAGRGVRALRFGARALAGELRGFLELLRDPKKAEDFVPGRVGAALRAHGIEHVTVGFDPLPVATLERASTAALLHYQALASCLQDSHVAAARGEELEIQRACGLVDAALSQAPSPTGLLALASEDLLDSFTVGHSVRVALLALQVATAGGASREQLIRIGTAGLLHDIGKSRIPQEVLFKRGRLSADEWEVMSRHPRFGGEILLEQAQPEPAAISAAFCHHMTPGGGYPVPAMKFQPCAISKLVRVCDVFEALTSVRPYKTAMTPLEAYAVMFRDPTAFDQEWLRFFVRSLGLYPQGTWLALDTGEMALVTGQGPTPATPEVQVVRDANGAPVPAATAPRCTIGERVEGVVRNVRAVVPEDSTFSPQGPPAEQQERAAREHWSGVAGCCGVEVERR